MSSWRHHRGRWLSPSASNVISHLTFYRKDSRPSALHPSPPPLFYPFWQPLPPALYINLEMISVPPFSMPSRIRQCHTALPNIIHLVRHQSGTQKMKCCCSSPFSQKGSPTFSAPLSLFPHRLVPSCYVWGIWNIFLCINIHTPPDCSLMSCFCLPAVQQRICLTENRHFKFTQDSLVLDTN